MKASTPESVDEASEEQIVRYGRVLATLAGRHGLTNLRRAGDGRIVADVDSGRTLLDIAGFELAAGGLLRADLAVISSRSEMGQRLHTSALVVESAA